MLFVITYFNENGMAATKIVHGEAEKETFKKTIKGFYSIGAVIGWEKGRNE